MDFRFDWKGNVAAAVSGGADSVALLLLLLPLRDQGQITLRAIHVNHGLRGGASDGDEAFVRELCARHQVPLDCVRLTPPEHPSEQWAREERYRAFAGCCRAGNIRYLALAHHMDDQAETMLLHLMRGSGLTGLCGMKRETERDGMTLIRPLLTLTRQELRDYLRSMGQEWREDASNQSDVYLRNRVRLELLPLMEQMSPGVSARIASAAELLGAEEACLSREAGQLLAEYPGRELPLEVLTDLPEAMQRRVLRSFLYRESGVTADRAATERMTALLQAATGTEADILEGQRMFRGRTHLHLLRQETAAESIPLDGRDGTYSMNGVTIRIARGGLGPGNGRDRQELPGKLLAGCELRLWQTGDVIRPFGAAGHQSLQDYFVNRRVDRPFRRRIPLICRGHEVLLVCGIGSGALPEWQQNEDNVSVTVEGDVPWRRADAERKR